MLAHKWKVSTHSATIVSFSEALLVKPLGNCNMRALPCRIRHSEDPCFGAMPQFDLGHLSLVKLTETYMEVVKDIFSRI